MEVMLERRPQRTYEEERPPPAYSHAYTVTQNRKTVEEKERHLQRRISELQTQTQRLERKIGLLKTENDSLKRLKDDQKPLEEKIKTLKKRNAELAAIARRLEEKAKHLQQENMKKSKEEMSQPESDQMKKMFARQRAKDLAEHAKAMLAKDREIEDLRKKCQELADTLSNAEFLGPENVQMYEEKEELVSIIKQAAKERLQMEKQLAKIKPNPALQIDGKKLKELEATNETLQKELAKLEKAKDDTEKLEIELTQKKIECETLTEEIRRQKERNSQLEGDLQETASENTQLTIQISDLQHRLQDFQKVNEECNILRVNLTEAQNECDLAKGERNVLQAKVEHLEVTVQNLKESADRLQLLENEHQITIQELHKKQDEIESLQQAQDSAKKEYEEVLLTLQNRVTDLQQNCHRQEERHKQLTHQLQILQSTASKNNIKHPPSSSHSASLISSSHPSSTSSHHSEDHLQSTPALHDSGHLVNGNEHHQVESTKSLDTGFADDDETELDNSNYPSPDQGKPQGDFEDPELNEISKKLKELEASDTEEELFTVEDKGEDSGMESQKEQRMKSKTPDNSRFSVLGKKGPIQVYIVKYSYNPFEHSPNENPDAELPLDAGDYVLVNGEMDEDGFYDGELIDGRKGLVPSNFIEKVADEDLPEFHAAMAGNNHLDDDTGNSIQHDLDFDSSDETEEKATHRLGMTSTEELKVKPNIISKTESSGRIQDSGNTLSNAAYPELIDLEVTSKPDASSQNTAVIPCPRGITLDRQLTNSIVISWKHPEEVESLTIKSYHILVDKEVKLVVRGNERTKALIENVDSRQSHRVCIRCTSNRGQSLDRQCTLLIGKDAVPAPSDLNASDITANSAHISWLPGNSNHQHSISVNGQDFRTVKAGICTYTLTGLAPNSVQRVKVSAKSLTSDHQGERLSAFVEFKTRAGGLPDPPISVQVEAGPREGTLLLTWLPVTIDTSGISNGAVVAGYTVYADGQQTKVASGPTNDHIILSSEDFKGFIPRQLFVRTVTVDNKESQDSETVKLPHTLINEITEGAAKSVAMDTPNKVVHVQNKPAVPQINVKGRTDNINGIFQNVMEGPERDLSPMIDNIEYEDDFVETSSSSELSDIPEEVEEEDPSTNLITSQGKLSPSLVNGHTSPSKGKMGKSSPRSSPNKRASPASTANKGTNSPRSATNRVVPAIEITRDSSSERGNSVDVSDEENKTQRNAVISKKGGSTTSEPPSPRYKTEPQIDSVLERPRASPKFLADMDIHDGYSDEFTGVTSSESFSIKSDSSSGLRDHNPEQKDVIHRPEISKKTGSKYSNNDSPRRSHKHGSKNSEMDSFRSGHSPRLREDQKPDPKTSQSISPQHKVKSDTRKAANSPQHMDKIRNDPNANKLLSDPYIIQGSAHLPDNSHEKEATVIPQLDLNDYDVEDSCDVDSISGEINPPIEDNRIRLFVALFDYDPESMSPNVESLDEELPFKEGQIIKIFGDKDADGFYRGECNGRVGFVPCNMVSEVQVDDPDLADQLLKETQAAFNLNTQIQDGDNFMKPVSINPEDLRSSPSRITTITANTQRRKMVALYDYDPQELSPNVDAELELSFKSGDPITVFGEMDDDGFYMGELNGQRGLVPSNFLQDAPLSDEENLESASVISPSRSGDSLNNLSGSRPSDLGVDKTKKMGAGPEMAPPSQPDGLSNSSQNQTPNRSRSVSPEDGKQKKKGSSILSKGKSIFKKLTR